MRVLLQWRAMAYRSLGLSVSSSWARRTFFGLCLRTDWMDAREYTTIAAAT